MSPCRCLGCQDYGDRHRLDNVDARLVESLRDPGWGVVMIPADETSPGWAFTVGLWHSWRVPEIAMFGMDPEVMMGYLNTVAAGGELTDFPTELMDVDLAWHKIFFGTALSFYRATPGVAFRQLLWASPGRPHLQPHLWRPPDQHPRGPWTDQI
jgi:uncharacterized protein DUF4262